MGLGKTIQVLSLLLVLKHEAGEKRQALPARGAGFAARQLGGGDRPICAKPQGRRRPSIGGACREPEHGRCGQSGGCRPGHHELWLSGRACRGSERQRGDWWCSTRRRPSRIRPPSRPERSSSSSADTRIALTGTPIENRLGDLWSIFDFINPGLLGSSKEFSSFVKRLADRPQNPYGPLRDLVRPYILRRLKTDKSIIADLPDKTEVKTFCPLSRKQAALYQQAVDDLAGQLEDVDGMKRRGIVLAFLMRLKQICNHPSQWLGDGAWAEEDSGKLARSARHRGGGRRPAGEGARLHPVQGDDRAAGGVPGLRCSGGPASSCTARLRSGSARIWCVSSRRTNASRSSCSPSKPAAPGSISPPPPMSSISTGGGIPAVENQATDRAFRIGQTKNVLVHKFVCRGTVEDKIDQMIESKQQLAGDFLSGGADMVLTEMKDEELLKLVALDLGAAMKEG